MSYRADYCRMVLLLLALLLLGLGAHGRLPVLDFTAGRLQEALGAKQGMLVEDDAADGGRAFEVKEALRLERYGDLTADDAGKLLRITLRAMAPIQPPADASLSLAVWSDTLWRTEARLDAREFSQTGQYVTVTRELMLSEIGRSGLWVTGGWPGLRIERLTYTVLDPPPVRLIRVWPKKLLYRLGETGVVEITAQNTTDTAQRARLTVAVESALANRVVIHDKDVEVNTGIQTIPIPLPPQPEYGHAVIAELRQGETVLGRATEYFFATNRPLHVGQYGGLGTGEGYGAESAAGAIMTHRRHYFPLLEIMFWAPCDMSQIAPPAGKERWWSGQTGKLGSVKKYQEYTRIAHEHGMSVVAYTVYNNVFGWRIFDLGRAHPDWLDWYGRKPSYRVGDMAVLRREDDAELETREGPIEPTSMCAFITAGNPHALKWHGDQLAAGINLFDIDGYRYDDWLNYDRTMVDLLGRKAPFNGWTNHTLFDYLRGRVRAAKPGAIFGHNMRWNQEEKPDPMRGIPIEYTEAVRDGSMALQEAWSNRAFTNRARWDDWAKRTLRAGTNCYRYGGEQYVITDVASDSGANAAERNYLVALEMAGGCHLAYGVQEEQTPYMRLACRYSDLLYGDNRHFPNPDETLRVMDDGQLWWRDYVRYRTVAPGKRVYYVHLFNPPVTENMREQPGKAGDRLGADEDPAPEGGALMPTPNAVPYAALRPPVRDVKLTWLLPDGWTPNAAYHITADGRGEIAQRSETQDRLYTYLEPTGLERQPLELIGTSVVVPQVRQWSIVAVECSGPANAPEPEERLALPPVPPLPDINAPIVALPVPEPVKSAPKPFLLRMIGVKREGMSIVDDPDAMGGKALKLGPKGFNDVDAAFAPAPPGPGRYRLTLRVKTPVPAPGGVAGFLSSSNNNTTLWAKPYRAEWAIPAAAFPAPGKWGEVTTEVVMTYPRYWGVFYGGWDGLLLDTFTLTPVEVFTDSQQLEWTNVQKWPAERPTPEEPAPERTPAPVINEPGDPDGEGFEIPPPVEEFKGPRIWLGNGLYCDYYGLDAVFTKTLGARVTRADHIMSWGTPSWQTARFPDTPGRLMRYGCVVLGNVPLATLTVDQRAWLRGYVRDGGSLLLLGGPYGFGNGGWQDSDLLGDMLPMTMTSMRDLRFVGEKAPVVLEPAGALAKGIVSKQRPMVFWQHLVSPKPDAAVHVTAGGQPVLITGTYGEGRVAVITATPLGEAPAGSTPFWEWTEWPTLMTTLGKWLLGM